MKFFTSLTILLHALFAAERVHAQCNPNPNTTMTGGNSASIGTLAWSNTNNIKTLNGSYATAGVFLGIGTVTTNYLIATDLGLTVPAGNTICGVGVTIQRGTSTLLILGQGPYDHSVQLIQGGVIGSTNEANTGAAWPNGIAAATYGGSADLWGLTLAPADVNSANFGVALSADLFSFIALSFTAEVDEIAVTVYSQNIVLPITLNDFTVTGGKEGNLLSWSAPPGVVEKFYIERSKDGLQFEPIDSTVANSSVGQYTYSDTHPLPGTNYYRLHLNLDGSAGYSVVAAIVSKAVDTVRFYPNPFHNSIDVNAPTPFTKLVLRDVQGRTLWVKEYSDGVYNAQVPASGLPQGLYFLSVDGTTYRVLKN